MLCWLTQLLKILAGRVPAWPVCRGRLPFGSLPSPTEPSCFPASPSQPHSAGSTKPPDGAGIAPLEAHGWDGPNEGPAPQHLPFPSLLGRLIENRSRVHPGCGGGGNRHLSAGFGALPSILPGPSEDEMQSPMDMGLFFPQVCCKVSLLRWCQSTRSFGGKSVFFRCSSKEKGFGKGW